MMARFVVETIECIHEVMLLAFFFRKNANIIGLQMLFTVSLVQDHRNLHLVSK